MTATASAMRERSPAGTRVSANREPGRASHGSQAPLSDGVPYRTAKQRADALEQANVVRTHRARQKRDLRAGRIAIVDLIDDELCQTMKVWDALIAMPKWGRVKVNRLLAREHISPSKTIGGLSHRQQSQLLQVLGR